MAKSDVGEAVKEAILEAYKAGTRRFGLIANAVREKTGEKVRFPAIAAVLSGVRKAEPAKPAKAGKRGRPKGSAKKRGPGRPKGSGKRGRPKGSGKKRGPGRPKGSKKRGPGRPKGSGKRGRPKGSGKRGRPKGVGKASGFLVILPGAGGKPQKFGSKAEVKARLTQYADKGGDLNAVQLYERYRMKIVRRVVEVRL